jgi:hypothetical protein
MPTAVFSSSSAGATSQLSLAPGDGIFAGACTPSIVCLGSAGWAGCTRAAAGARGATGGVAGDAGFDPGGGGGFGGEPGPRVPAWLMALRGCLISRQESMGTGVCPGAGSGLSAGP